MRRWDWIWYSRTLHWRKFLKSLRRFWLRSVCSHRRQRRTDTGSHHLCPAGNHGNFSDLSGGSKKRGFTYDAVAGHSLGEYAAMVASGMLSLEDGFRVIKARSEAMDAAAKAADGAMCAILKLAPAEVERICQETEGYVIPANYNSSVQTVIAGDRDAVEKAAAACAALKARAVPLAVASAFHTKLMQPAADTFYKAIQNVKFSAPTVPFYSNVLGAVRTDFSDMPKALAEHIVSPVRFTDELAAMQAAALTPLWNSVPRAFSPDWSRKPSRA